MRLFYWVPNSLLFFENIYHWHLSSISVIVILVWHFALLNSTSFFHQKETIHSFMTWCCEHKRFSYSENGSFPGIKSVSLLHFYFIVALALLWYYYDKNHNSQTFHHLLLSRENWKILTNKHESFKTSMKY